MIQKFADIDRWIKLIEQHSALESIDRDLLESLIERIEIGPSSTEPVQSPPPGTAA